MNNFSEKFLSESPRFTKGLLSLFPNYLQTYLHFVEMIYFCRKYEPKVTTNEKAKSIIGGGTTLYDRFLMLCLGIYDAKQFQKLQLTKEELDRLLCDYMMLFIEKPRGGDIDRVLDFISLKA